MEDFRNTIAANFELNTVYPFQVRKYESFTFMDSPVNVFEAEYTFQIRRIEDNIYEAFFEDTVFYPIKGLREIQPLLKANTDLRTKTIFYQLNEGGDFVLKNIEGLKQSAKHDLAIILAAVDKEKEEEFTYYMEEIFDSIETMEDYIIQDLINLHYCEGVEIDTDYYIDLKEEDSIESKLAKSALDLDITDTDECALLKFEILSSNDYQLSIFKAKNILPDPEHPNQTLIDPMFLKEKMLGEAIVIDEFGEGIFSLHEFKISSTDHILKEYSNDFKVQTPKMHKHIDYQMTLLID